MRDDAFGQTLLDVRKLIKQRPPHGRERQFEALVDE